MATTDKNAVPQIPGMEEITGSIGEKFGEIGAIMEQINSFGKGLSNVTSALGGLVNVVENVQGIMNGLANAGKQLGTGGSGVGGGSGFERGALMNSGADRIREVLNTVKSNQGKTTESGRPYAFAEASRQTGYREADIKQAVRMATGQYAERMGLGGFSQKDFPYIRNYTPDRMQVGDVEGQINKMVVSGVNAAKTNITSAINSAVNAGAQPTTGAAAARTSPVAQVQAAQRTAQQTPQMSNLPVQTNSVSIQQIGGQAGVSIATGGGGGGGKAGGGQVVVGGSGSNRGAMGSHGADFDLNRFLQFASPFSPLSLGWMAMFGTSGQMYPAFQGLAEPSMAGGEWSKQGVRGTMGFGASFTGLPALGKMFNQVATTDAFELYESMHSSFTVLKNVYGSQEKAASSIEQSIQLARETPLQVRDLLKVFSTFSVNPQLRGVLSNKEQMGQLATGVSGLGFLVPEQGTEGAIFAIREALAGQFRSLRNRFNINPELIAAGGGMSMSEMKEKPTNFLSALNSFLKMNLGQQTFTELQMTFSKQAGNIMDSITGGIFKAFRETGMYSSATNFTAELSNTTGKFFESNTFGDFFAGFGQKVSTQFSKATNVLKSIDFDSDSPKTLQDKMGKTIGLITKDLVYSISPQMDQVVGVVAPMAKKVGTMVASYLGRGTAEIFSSAFGIGMASIVNTLEAPLTSILPKPVEDWYGQNIRPVQTDFVTEHPIATFAAGYMGTKGLKNLLTTGTQKYGGIAPAITTKLEQSALMGTLGMGGTGGALKAMGLVSALPLLYSAYQGIRGAGETIPDAYDLQTSIRSRYETGQTKIGDYFTDTYEQYRRGYPYKQESMSLMGAMGAAIPFGMMAYNTLSGSGSSSALARGYTASTPSFANLGLSPTYGLQKRYSFSNQNTFFPFGTSRGASLGIEEAYRRMGLAETDIAADRMAGGVNPRRTQAAGGLQAPTEISKKTYTLDQGIVGGAQQAMMLGYNPTSKLDNIKNKLSGWVYNYVSKGVERLDPAGALDVAKLSYLQQNKSKDYLDLKNLQAQDPEKFRQIFERKFGAGYRKEFPDEQKAVADYYKSKGLGVGEAVNKAGQREAFSYDLERMQRLRTGVAVGAGVLATGSMLLADYMLPEKELTASQQKQMQLAQGAAGMLGAAGQMAMFMPGGQGIGMGLMAAGAVTGIASKIFIGDPQAEQKKRQEAQMKEANKAVNSALNAVIEGRITGVKEISELTDIENVMTENQEAKLGNMISGGVADKKFSQSTGNALKKDLVGFARRVSEGQIKEVTSGYKEWMSQGMGIPTSEFKELTETEAESLYTTAKAYVTQKQNPQAATQATATKDLKISEMMRTNPIFAGVNIPAKDLVKGSLQQDLGAIGQNFTKVQSSIISGISATLQAQGRSLEESTSIATSMGSKLGLDKMSKAITQIQPFAMGREQFVSDSVFGIKTKAEDIFGPSWFKDIGSTQKAYSGTLDNLYKQQLLYTAQAPATGITGLEGKELEKKQRDLASGAFVMNEFVSAFPQAVPSDMRNQVLTKKTEEYTKAMWESVTQFYSVDKMTDQIAKTMTEFNLDVGALTDPKKAKVVEDRINALSKDMLGGLNTIMEQAQEQSQIRGNTGAAESSITPFPKDIKDVIGSGLFAAGGRKEFEERIKSSYRKASSEQEMPVETVAEYGKMFEERTKLTSFMNYRNNLAGLQTVKPTDDLREAIRTSLQGEGKIKIAENLKSAFGGYINQVNNDMNSLGQDIGGLTGMAGGGYGQGMAQPYRFVNGKMMASSWSWGGQEIPDMFTQQAIQDQRERNVMSGGQVAQINTQLQPMVTQFNNMYSNLLKEGVKSTEMYGSPSPTTLQMIGKYREMGAQLGVMPTPEQQSQEMLIRLSAFNASMGGAEKGSYGLTMKGMADIPREVAMALGTEFDFGAGKTGMQEGGVMSGLAVAADSVSQAFSSVTTILPTLTSNFEALSGAVEGVNAKIAGGGTGGTGGGGTGTGGAEQLGEIAKPIEWKSPIGNMTAKPLMGAMVDEMIEKANKAEAAKKESLVSLLTTKDYEAEGKEWFGGPTEEEQKSKKADEILQGTPDPRFIYDEKTEKYKRAKEDGGSALGKLLGVSGGEKALKSRDDVIKEQLQGKPVGPQSSLERTEAEKFIDLAANAIGSVFGPNEAYAGDSKGANVFGEKGMFEKVSDWVAGLFGVDMNKNPFDVPETPTSEYRGEKGYGKTDFGIGKINNTMDQLNLTIKEASTGGEWPQFTFGEVLPDALKDMPTEESASIRQGKVPQQKQKGYLVDVNGMEMFGPQGMSPEDFIKPQPKEEGGFFASLLKGAESVLQFGGLDSAEAGIPFDAQQGTAYVPTTEQAPQSEAGAALGDLATAARDAASALKEVQTATKGAVPSGNESLDLPIAV